MSYTSLRKRHLRARTRALPTSCAIFVMLIWFAPIFLIAQTPGISSSEIKIGSCSALDGPARQLGLETVLGATAFFDYINDQGGIGGRKLTLSSHDDGYDPEKTAGCFAQLKKDGIFSGAFFVGTPTAAKYVPMAEADKIPIVGLFTGAPFLTQPPKHYIFSVRASYNDETREQVDSLWKAGVRKIGVIYRDDAFGNVVLEGVKAALAKHGAAPAGLGKFVRNTLDVGKAVEDAHSQNPQAVIFASPYAPAAQILKQTHAQSWRPLFLTVSFVGTEALIKVAGNDAEGVVITQVVPPYDRVELPTVKLYRESISKYMSGTQPSFVSFEGFIDAIVVVQGLRKAGADPTREKFIAAIESMHDTDIGLGEDTRLMFSAHHHQGLDHVYPTVIHDGKPQIITNWQSVVKH
ncbi:MAG TPA: ABC transporter substrate-binding protein [Terriglobales bacterium]|nr:ABC transporter substrate-binding protein [Terriglobales bacterium]